ncbi:hypothetical protein SK128_014529, partial [Halocaridina rubra]
MSFQDPTTSCFGRLIFLLTLQFLFQRGETTGFIIAESCSAEVTQAESIVFLPGEVVWMQVVPTTFLVLLHGVVRSTSAPSLRSHSPGGGSCNVTPHKTMM